MTRNQTRNVTKLLQNLNIGGKVLFSGVFYISSIFQNGGMVMDENGRNGGNWHLAQQIVQPVIRYVLSSTTFQQQITHHVIIQKKQQIT